MPATDQSSFFDPEYLCPDCLEVGTVPWLLARHATLLTPMWLVRQWDRPGLPGRPPWPSAVLFALLVLRFLGEGMSRRAAVKRARTDAEWRAAMRLSWTDRTPGRRVVGRYERFLQERDPETGAPRYLLLFAHIVQVCLAAGVVKDQAAWGTDSTHMLCYGAVRDTVRQLGDGMRALAVEWARATGQSVREVASAWGHPLLLAKSTKGYFRIDWSARSARSAMLKTLVETALDIVERVRSGVESVRRNKRKGLLRRARNLARVVAQDIACDDDGVYSIVWRNATDRLISVTEPQARAGRKTRKKKFNGFKVHVVGEFVSGLLVAMCVTPGDQDDGRHACRLLGRAKGLVAELERILGDTAYGSARLRHVVRCTTGVEIVAPPVSDRRRAELFEKRDFEVDFAENTMTCPARVTVGQRRWSWSKAQGVHVPVFLWTAATCRECRLRPQCRGDKKGGKSIELHAYEQGLQRLRAAWQDPAVREEYRLRGQTERLVCQMTRHGARQARTWGLGPAQLQAHIIGLGCTLQLLARCLAAAPG